MLFVATSTESPAARAAPQVTLFWKMLAVSPAPILQHLACSRGHCLVLLEMGATILSKQTTTAHSKRAPRDPERKDLFRLDVAETVRRSTSTIFAALVTLTTFT
jgi:hypothetical protein